MGKTAREGSKASHDGSRADQDADCAEGGRSWKKWAMSAAALAVVALGIFAMVKFLPTDVGGMSDGIGADIDDNSGAENKYFTVEDYDILEVEKTLKEYALEIEKPLLYFDWYAETDYLESYAWRLKDKTKEIICFQEELVDFNTGCVVQIFIIDVDLQVDVFSEDENTTNSSQIAGVSIDWRMKDDKAFLNFEYQGYRYYLRVKEPIDEPYVLSLAEELLSQKL